MNELGVESVVHYFLASVSLSSIVGFISFLVRTLVDYGNMSNIERILSKKSDIVKAKILVVTVISILTTVFLMWMYFLTEKNFSWSVLIVYIILFITIFSIVCVCVLLLSSLFFGFLNFCTIKFTYYLEYDKDKWQIIKKIDNNLLLLFKKSKGYKIVGIDTIDKKVIEVGITKAKWQWIYFSNKYINIFKGVVFGATAIMFLSLVLQPGELQDTSVVSRVVLVILIFISMLLSSHYFVVYANKKTNDNYKVLDEEHP